MTKDLVSHPPHYTSSEAECDSCGSSTECISVTRHMGFNIGNIIKYLWRFDKKNGVEDLKKARWYLDDLIKQKEMAQEPNPGCEHSWKPKEDINGLVCKIICRLCGVEK